MKITVEYENDEGMSKEKQEILDKILEAWVRGEIQLFLKKTK